MSALRLATIIICGAAVSSCADDRQTFFIQQVQVAGEDCAVEADEGGEYQTSGTLDVSFSWQYVMHPLLRNQMVPIANSDNYQAETNGILVEGANVRIWRGGRPDEDDVFWSFYQPASSYVGPDSITASGFAVLPRQAVIGLLRDYYGGDRDPNTLTTDEFLGYRDLITVGVTMLGTTSGNEEVETPEFYFPIHLCFGCLVYCPWDSQDEEGNFCQALSAPESAGCYLGQDNLIDCRYCSTSPYLDTERCRSFCFGGI